MEDYRTIKITKETYDVIRVSYLDEVKQLERKGEEDKVIMLKVLGTDGYVEIWLRNFFKGKIERI